MSLERRAAELRDGLMAQERAVGEDESVGATMVEGARGDLLRLLDLRVELRETERALGGVAPLGPAHGRPVAR